MQHKSDTFNRLWALPQNCFGDGKFNALANKFRVTYIARVCKASDERTLEGLWRLAEIIIQR